MQARRQARKTLETGDDLRRQKTRSNTCEGSKIKSAWLQYEPVAMAYCLPDGKAFPSLQIRSHVGVSICCRAQDLESPNSDQPPARQLLPVSLPHSHIGNRNIETCLCRHRQAALTASAFRGAELQCPWVWMSGSAGTTRHGANAPMASRSCSGECLAG